MCFKASSQASEVDAFAIFDGLSPIGFSAL
jgi:hypothetical protein